MSDSDEDVEYEAEFIEIGPHTFSITTVAFLPIQHLMRLRTEQSEISGQKMWCGSLCLCQLVMNYPTLCERKSVIELGAGTGIVGMTCARVGASDVVLTDRDNTSILHMKADCASNNVPADVVTLDWLNPDLTALLGALHGSVPVVRVLAGDVLYRHALIEPFFNTINSILDAYAHSDIEVLLCHVPRAGVGQYGKQFDSAWRAPKRYGPYT